MSMPVQHIYKEISYDSGMLYAWFFSMHTRVDIILWGKEEEPCRMMVSEIYKELQALERIGSFFDPESELCKVNREASQAPVRISSELYTMLDTCLAYNKQTFGCFDVTVQSENYDSDTYAAVCLSPGDSTVYYQRPGIRIDLSGFLKGYALEEIRLILQKHQQEDALVNMGNSSVLALGNHPHGEGWKVNFEATARHTVAVPDVVLHNQCLTTSGNDAPERSHLVSPHNGKTIEGVGRVAVVTDSGAVGEILSTGLFVASPSLRKKLMKRFSLQQVYYV